MRQSSVICLLAIFLVAGSALGQGDALPQVQVERPRDFGYFTGDLLELRASVRVPERFTLDARSLEGAAWPDWLEVREINSTLQQGTLSIRYLFQLFYVPDSVTHLSIPERRLVFRSEDTGEALQASISGFTVGISPLTDSSSGLEPDWIAPRPSTYWIRLLAGSLAILLGVWMTSVAVERRRQRRLVFRRADRELRSARDCGEAMLVLHRALEERAGKALFPHDLDALAERWPPAAEVRSDLEQFFALSSAHFYRNHGTDGSADCLSWVRQLSNRLMTLERRFGDGEPAAGRR